MYCTKDRVKRDHTGAEGSCWKMKWIWEVSYRHQTSGMTDYTFGEVIYVYKEEERPPYGTTPDFGSLEAVLMKRCQCVLSVSVQRCTHETTARDYQLFQFSTICRAIFVAWDWVKGSVKVSIYCSSSTSVKIIEHFCEESEQDLPLRKPYCSLDLMKVMVWL